jgi:phage-related protein
MPNWSVITLNKTVDKELSLLPVDMGSHLVRITLLLEEFGPHKVGMPHVKHLSERLWEIRISGRDGIARCLFYIAPNFEIVIVHAFIKKTQKTPLRSIQTAFQRIKREGTS